MGRRIGVRVQKLHQQFTEYGRSAREWMRKCVMLLPEIERERVWKKKGFGSIYEYAGKLAGMSRECVNDALRVMHATENMPEMRKVIEERGINAVKPIITALTSETESFWAEKIREMSQHTLQVYRRELEKHNDERGAPSEQVQTDKAIIMQLEPDIADQLEKLKAIHNNDWNAVMRELLDMKEKIVKQREQNIQETNPAATETSSRHIPIEIERHIIQRSSGICEFPRCKRPYAILHHTQRFALDQRHNPAQIIALCTPHERLAHLGLIQNEEQKPNTWEVRKMPDAKESKYTVDQKVQKFRRPK